MRVGPSALGLIIQRLRVPRHASPR